MFNHSLSFIYPRGHTSLCWSPKTENDTQILDKRYRIYEHVCVSEAGIKGGDK